MTGIAMQGMSDIMALYSEGASSLCVNGSVDMLGMRTGLAGTVYPVSYTHLDVYKRQISRCYFSRKVI